MQRTYFGLGHIFGLTHCGNTRCVMHFSNSLSYTDIKEKLFCNICKKELGTKT
jgi:archaemetzincin